MCIIKQETAKMSTFLNKINNSQRIIIQTPIDYAPQYGLAALFLTAQFVALKINDILFTYSDFIFLLYSPILKVSWV